MQNKGRRPHQKRKQRAANLDYVLRRLIRHVRSPAKIIELYYWSQEPGLREFMRSVVAMAPESRAPLQAFFAMESEPDHIEVFVDPSGRLTLTSPQVQESLAILANLEATHTSSPSRRTH